jgi:transcriptional regulator with XRE-family HTH domain
MMVANPTDAHVGARVRMRRMMLKMSQSQLGDGLQLTFQQVQKYEKGTNRISASRLQQIALVLQVPIPFFFEGLPEHNTEQSVSPAYVSQFLATFDGLSLTESFTRIKRPGLRRSIVALVQQIAGDDDGSPVA